MTLKDYLSFETVSGELITIGETRLTPQSQNLTVRWPGGGWVWNRPVAVLVEENGQVSRIPILDLTRIVQIGFLIVSLAAGLFAFVTRLSRWISR